MENTEVAPEVQTEEPTQLPSEVDSVPTFEINSDDVVNGKFQDKWSSPQEMADHIKNIEDKYANLSRDVSDKTKQTDAEIQTTADDIKIQQLQSDTVKDMIPEFLEAGMVVTDEMKAKLVEAGLSEDKIKIGAYEFKEALDKNAAYVGGKENYDIIMNTL